jgi:hypothetical protein
MHFLQAKTEIRDRINELEKQHRNYLAYQQDRVNERDHHGAWDVAINLSETECEMAGLRFALEKMDQVDFPRAPRLTDYPAQPGGYQAYLRDGGDPGKVPQAELDAYKVSEAP